MRDVTIAIIGAGPAGIGVAACLKRAGLNDVLILEQKSIGHTFTLWPEETRFISPSFKSNMFNMIDMNAITPDTSPAQMLETEHPSGKQYVRYLEDVVMRYELPVLEQCHVHDVRPDDVGFHVHTSEGTISARFVIWAAGEFQYPKKNSFPGARLCTLSSEVSSWKNHPGSDHIIIGGFESGIGAAVALSREGKNVTVLDAGVSWEPRADERPNKLSPYTLSRLRRELPHGRITLVGNVLVKQVTQRNSAYDVDLDTGQRIGSSHPPILATGFAGSITLVTDFFEWLDDGSLFLNEYDESTLHPGLFVVGPNVVFEGILLHGIHMFRQRFPVIVETIAQRLGYKVRGLETYRRANMYLKNE